jgi:hypothetical protein
LKCTHATPAEVVSLNEFFAILGVDEVCHFWCVTGAVANLHGHAEKEASAILFWEHIFAVISLTFWLILYLRILF